MVSIDISSGHSKYVRGASKYIDEVTEARKVVSQTVAYLSQLGASVEEIHDNVSRTQNDNLNYLLNLHNNDRDDWEVSIHFNSGGGTGTEVYHYGSNTKEMARKLSKNISSAMGLRDRGAKQNKDLRFLKGTKDKALLIEICFVDNKEDVQAYQKNFDKVCRTIAETLTGKKLTPEDKLYRVQVGAFTNKENAEKLQKELQKKGYPAIIK